MYENDEAWEGVIKASAALKTIELRQTIATDPASLLACPKSFFNEAPA